MASSTRTAGDGSGNVTLSVAHQIRELVSHKEELIQQIVRRNPGIMNQQRVFLVEGNGTVIKPKDSAGSLKKRKR